MTHACRQSIRRLLPVLAACALALAGACAQARNDWPKVALPDDAKVFPIGEQVAVNGMPMRMQGFVSKASPAESAAWFRRSLGKPLVENTVGKKLVLGRAQGPYYISVQLEALGPSHPGTRALVAVSDLTAAYERRDDTKAASERLLARLPAGTHLVSKMSSGDGGKSASYVVLTNSFELALNRERLIGMLREDGYALEREALADTPPGQPSQVGLDAGKTLFFKGAGKEAIAVISRDLSGKTTLVLNTVTFMEHLN